MAKKNKSLLLFFIILPLLCCCSIRYNNELSRIENLLDEQKNDSALTLLNSIDTVKFTKDDYALYKLLTTICKYKLYMPITSVSSISESIECFEESGDKEHLAQAYMYRACIIGDYLGRPNDCIIDLKKAENLAKDIDDDILNLRIKTYLSHVNRMTGNNKLAESYAKQAYHAAKENNNGRWIGHCCLLLDAIYAPLGKADSCKKYTEEAITYIKEQPEQERALYLNNIAIYYKTIGKPQEAERYFLKSIEIKPNADAYGNLSIFYTSQGMPEKAEKMWQAAFNTDNLQSKIIFMKAYIDWLASRGKHQEANRVAHEVIELKDSLSKQQQTEAAKELQDKFNQQIMEENLKHYIIIAGYFCIIVSLLALGLWINHRRKVALAKKQLSENQALILEYQHRIEVLTAQGMEQSKEVKELTKKMESLREKQGKMLSSGKQRFEEIMNGGTTALWHKPDFNDFLEYYRMLNLAFMVHLEQDYKSLTSNNQMLLCLYELGYDNAEVMRIMNLTDGALRTMKSRISKKEK